MSPSALLKAFTNLLKRDLSGETVGGKPALSKLVLP